jgi:hypothetical protein
MAKLVFGAAGAKRYETGVDNGVLFTINPATGQYNKGVVWNGLTSVTEKPTGAENNEQYADNGVYANLISVEKFEGSIAAFTYPDTFMACDGTATVEPGVYLGQQNRVRFGLCYRTRVGNDTLGDAFGEKLHFVWGALASPSEKQRSTVNDSPEAAEFSWDFTTQKVNVADVDGVKYRPTSYMSVDSTKVAVEDWEDLLDLVYGTEGSAGPPAVPGTDSTLPTPDALIALFS